VSSPSYCGSGEQDSISKLQSEKLCSSSASLDCDEVGSESFDCVDVLRSSCGRACRYSGGREGARGVISSDGIGGKLRYRLSDIPNTQPAGGSAKVEEHLSQWGRCSADVVSSDCDGRMQLLGWPVEPSHGTCADDT
jgi:hypothetical protein